MRRETFKTPVALFFAFSLSALSACGSDSQLMADADILCDAFDPEVLKQKYTGLWLSDVEKAIYENLEEDLETDELKAVIGGRATISNYADIYPYIRDRVKEATGSPWECQNMASFYEIDFVPPGTPDRPTTSVLEIQQVAGLTFLIDDVKVDFSEPQHAADIIRDKFGEPQSVTIRLAGESKDELPKVLEVMNEIGAQSVKTVTPVR